jgi:hypothetical protein
MHRTISNEIIRSINLKSNLLNIITDENEELTVRQWVEKYRNVVPTKDIFWLLLRKEFMSEKDLRLFAVWCAREALKLVENPDERSVNACNVAERYANGEATREELDVAYDAAYTTTEAACAASYEANLLAYATADSDRADAVFTAYFAAHAAANAAHVAVNAARVASFAARDTACNAATASVRDARAAARDAATASLYDTAVFVRDVTRAAQIDQLLTYFE